MQTCLDCIPCFFNQTLSAGRMMGLPDHEIKRLLDAVGKGLEQVSLESTPPEMARLLQRIINQKTGSQDPYKELKHQSNVIALGYAPKMQQLVVSSEDQLLTAIEVAIAGNIIDYGAIHDLDVDAELQQLMNTERMQLEREDSANFAYQAFSEDLKQAKTLLYIGDNAGEIVFDKILLTVIRSMYPDLRITFAVRGKPILNDVLLEDAQEAGLTEMVQVISSGSDAPGCVLDYCDESFLEVFRSSDMIISKGQGNFEALSDEDAPIYYLLIAKCAAVARELSCSVRDIILKRKQR
ncbi:MAG: ARMT1-like domain-containing protein [Spirochaetia bacterium]|nr:ARMT1-like domain-containing protein [Spirochaetia bacterium]MCF7941793.1 ARMT1-like domain-containing protein [Spirochaetia bacterium]